MFNAQLLTCTLLPLCIYRVESQGVAAGASVCVMTQSSLSFSDMGLGLAFFVLGDTLLSTPVSFLFLLDTWGDIERKVQSIGFSEAVNLPQGVHTNSDGLGIKGCQEHAI